MTTALIFSIIWISACSDYNIKLKSVLKQKMVENSKEHGIPAQALMIMHNQEVLFRDSLGIININSKKPVNNDTVFPIYSTSKLFASTLVLQLHEAGKLDLSEVITNFIPDLPIAWREIRVKHLLNHTSGLPEYFNCENKECTFPASFKEAITNLRSSPLQFKPGTQMRYNQTNYLLLKTVIEKVANTSYRKLVNSQIIEPLQLHNTWFGLANVPQNKLATSYHSESGDSLQENKIRFPDYAISQADAYSTINDLSNFLSALAQGKLISKQLLTNYWKPYLLNDGQEGYFSSGWDYEKTGTWNELGHDGGGLVRVRILFRENLDDHYIIVYLTNGNKDGVWSRTLVDSVQYFLMPDMFSRVAMLL